MTEYLASNGIKVIPGQRHTTEALRGLRWTIKGAQRNTKHNPQQAQMSTKSDGSTSIRFTNYEPARRSIHTSYADDDREEFSGVRIKDEGVWDLLGEPSGKYDLYGKYSPPEWALRPQEPVVPRGWGREEDEDDGKRDDDPYAHLHYIRSMPREAPISKLEVEASSTAEGGGKEAEAKNESAFTLAEELSAMEYPKLDKLKEKAQEGAYSSVTSNYRPPPQPMMGPVNFPPSTIPKPDEPGPSNWSPSHTRFTRRHPTNMWNLPEAQQNQGAMLVLPDDIGLYEDVISRWESITLNLVNSKTFQDKQAKVDYIENLLGEREKELFQEWRMAYPEE